jgi:hypothetical protein
VDGLPAHVTDLLEWASAKAGDLLEPRGGGAAAEARFEDRKDSLVCAGRRLVVGPIVAARLRRSRGLAVFVATIGPKLEQEVGRLFRADQPLEGYILSAFGSEAVETWTDVLAARIAALVETAGWRCTNRFSPGYCTWDTGGQRTLFELLPARPAGVTLNQYAVMLPMKSVSGIIGLGPDVEHRPYPCDHCGIEDCTHRPVPAPRS